jgi:hypothetical protein
VKYIECIFDEDTMLREKKDPRFTVAWDLDCTLASYSGDEVRPGAVQALQLLRNHKIKLVIWTNSRAERAMDIIDGHGFDKYFDYLIARESYMLEEVENLRPETFKRVNEKSPREIEFQKRYLSGKNLMLLGYDVLIDDNPIVRREAEFWNNKYRVFVCQGFTGESALRDPGQITEYAEKAVRMSRWQFLRRFLR